MRTAARLAPSLLAALALAGAAATGAERPVYASPYAIAMAPDGSRLYVSHHTAGAVSEVDPAARKVVRTIEVGGEPAGLALAPDGATLYVANAADGSVAAVDLKAGRVAARVDAGRSAYGLELGPDGRLFVCDRFRNRIVVVDPVARKRLGEMPATREPLFAALQPGGKTLCVSNMLPLGPSTDPDNSATIDFYDAAARKHLGAVRLPSGGTDVHQVACSPDGKWAYVVHVQARFNVPPTQLVRGWINNSGLTILDLERRKPLTTLVLDETSRGSAVPFGVACTRDGATLAIGFAGTHEVALVDLAGLHEALAKEPQDRLPQLVNELSLLTRYGVIRRVPSGGYGPRGVAIEPQGKTLYVANYYSDNLGVVNVGRAKLLGTIPLGASPEPGLVRRGERFFNDATLCFQHWQSCASCHPEGRADELNWDLLNDGMGNPKNARSLLDSHRTPPVMSTGVRAKMEVATRSGLRYILFHEVDEDEAQAIDAYLRAMAPRVSPYREPDGSLAPAARRGEKLFESTQTGCARCHAAPLYTDLKLHNVGTRGAFDRRDGFDNPSLIEIWRTGPYLHDGGAVTLRDVLTTHNQGDRHGRTSHLSPKEIDDLIAFLLSL